MAPRRSRPHRLLLPTILAAVLAAEITGLAIARTLVPLTPAEGVAVVAPAATTAAPSGVVAGRPLLAAQADAGDIARQAVPAGSTGPTSLSASLAMVHAIGRSNAAHSVASGPQARSGSRASSGGHPASAIHEGRNHVWIPSLGISKAVQSFACSRSRPPDAGVYRWGCGGHNNVYLMGHAWSTFKPLHDAYVTGRLHAGMQVVYADGGGTVHTYSVVWWRVVAPTTAASWAWASLATPGMTLQTCVGANSQYRLMVRLVRVG